MEWIDLKENDILEYNPEFLEFYKRCFGKEFWETYNSIKPFINKFLVVNTIIPPDKHLRPAILKFRSTARGKSPDIAIMADTGAFHAMEDGPPIFRIVSLSEDD